MSNAILIKWLSRAALITQRPRGTFTRISLVPNFESIPRQPPLTPPPLTVGLMVATSKTVFCVPTASDDVEVQRVARTAMLLQAIRMISRLTILVIGKG